MSKLSKLFWASAVLSLPGMLSSAVTPVDTPQMKQSLGMQCSVRCSRTKLGTPQALVSWYSLTRREARAADQQLEVTVYHDGFERGRYVALRMTPGNRSFVNTANRVPNREMPEALNLRAVSVDFAAINTTLKSQRPRTTVVVEGIDPGVNYHWRLSHRVGRSWISSEIATCQAPTCPVDRAR